jgi:hypothetical protein
MVLSQKTPKMTRFLTKKPSKTQFLRAFNTKNTAATASVPLVCT